MTKCLGLKGLFSTSRVLCKRLVTASLPSPCSPRGTEEAPSPRRGFFFFGWRRFHSVRAFAGGLDCAGKSEARLLGRASPVSGLRFSLSYARISWMNVSRASVAILGQLEGRPAADSNKSPALPKSHRGRAAPSRSSNLGNRAGVGEILRHDRHQLLEDRRELLGVDELDRHHAVIRIARVHYEIPPGAGLQA